MDRQWIDNGKTMDRQYRLTIYGPLNMVQYMANIWFSIWSLHGLVYGPAYGEVCGQVYSPVYDPVYQSCKE